MGLFDDFYQIRQNILKNRQAASTAKRAMIAGPSLYHEIVLGNGAVMHLFGETHAHKTWCDTCSSPECARMNIVQLLNTMITHSTQTKSQLDIFIEDDIGNSKQVVPFKNNKNFTANNYNDLRIYYWLKQVRHQLVAFNPTGGNPNVRTRHPYTRVHFIDLRDNDPKQNKGARLHAGTSELYDMRKNGRDRTPQFERLHSTIMKSEKYVKNVRKYVSPNTQVHRRDYHSMADGITVSRVRKALLKLRPDVAAKLEAAADHWFSQPDSKIKAVVNPNNSEADGRWYKSFIAMDAYHLARMLYYAGYHATDKPTDRPSKMLVSYDGLAHTVNMVQMLRHMIKAGFKAQVGRAVKDTGNPGCIKTARTSAADFFKK